jgi:hypothetical protein
MTLNIQGNPLYAKLHKKKDQEHILYTIKTEKRVEPRSK